MAAKQSNLMLQLGKHADEALYVQIYEQIRSAIVSGALGEGDRLPSVRRLAAEQEISHTTVEQAYLQLVVEGYVDNVPRSGYRVKKLDTGYLQLDHMDASALIRAIEEERSREAFAAENELGAQARYDFSFANLQPDSFPVKTWLKLMSQCLYAKTSPEMARYASISSPSALRVELAKYLQRVRGVQCAPSQVFVHAGTGEALSVLLQLFDRRRDSIGMEEPGYYVVPEIARRNGYHIVPLRVDPGTRTFIDAVKAQRPRIVFTTPSHQFPTGAVMPMETRIELLRWAKDNDAYIIEDDSCNEYRYNTRPIPSLQSLDAYGRVIYLGNMSKVLSPSMRCAYFVLPPMLYARYLQLFTYAHPSFPWLEQEVLARFISEGHLDQHVRKMNTSNHRRHDMLLAELRERFGSMIEVSGSDAGMHLFVKVKNGMSQRELLESAFAQGVKVYGTQQMWFSAEAPEDCVIIGFSAIADEDIPAGVEALARAWLRR